jgi:hypothetical protein
MSSMPDFSAELRHKEDQALSEFLAATGVSVIETNHRLWYSSGLKIFQPLPCDRPMRVGNQEMDLLWEKGALFLRYPVAEEETPAFPSYIYLVDDKNYGMESLSGNQRNKIRRALKHCTVRKIDMRLILNQGPDLIQDTYQRQERHFDKTILDNWIRYFTAASTNPLFESWGAFVGDQLAAYRVDFTYRGGIYGDALFNRRDLLKYHIMNALVFVSTRELIRRDNITHVSYGMRGLIDEQESVTRFKQSMGYLCVSTCERIEVSPLLKTAFDWGGAALIRAVSGKLSRKSAKAQRILGMISAYINQEPGCVSKCNTFETGDRL